MVARLALVAFVLTAACTRPADTAVDAAPEDASCYSSYTFTPVSVTGTSPLGPLDMFHVAFAVLMTGPCMNGDYYLIDFAQTPMDYGCSPFSLQMTISPPLAATGTSSASAIVGNGPAGATTDAVSFEASGLDPPDATPPHIVGRFVSHDPAWSFDFAVDFTVLETSVCAGF